MFDEVRFRGTNHRYCTGSNFANACRFGGTAPFNIYGNIMSLYWGNEVNKPYSGYKTVGEDGGTFAYLFSSTKVVSAEDLIMDPKECSYGMFFRLFGSSTLQIPPKLYDPDEFKSELWGYMFYQCPLQYAPEIPVVNNTYYKTHGALLHATAITTAPELNIITCGNSAFMGMFGYCRKLITPPPIIYVPTAGPYAFRQMFAMCSSLEESPEFVIPSKADVTQLFGGCSNLRQIKVFTNSVSISTNFSDGVASEGVFYKTKGCEGPTGVDGIPEGGEVVEVEPVTTSAAKVRQSAPITYKSKYPNPGNVPDGDDVVSVHPELLEEIKNPTAQ